MHRLQQTIGRLWKDYVSSIRRIGRPAFDPETVHQARVTIRRLRVALRLAQRCGSGDTRKLRKELRATLRSLGQVRDLDVHAAMLKGFGARYPSLGTLRRAFELGHATALGRVRNRLAQQRVEKEFRTLQRKAAPWADSEDANGSRFTSQFLRLLERQHIRAGRALKSPPNDPGAWHRVRRALRTLRYLLELAPPPLEESAERLLVQLRSWQGRLGEIQDWYTLRLILTRTESPLGTGVTSAAREAVEHRLSASIRKVRRKRGRLARLVDSVKRLERM